MGSPMARLGRRKKGWPQVQGWRATGAGVAQGWHAWAYGWGSGGTPALSKKQVFGISVQWDSPIFRQIIPSGSYKVARVG